MMRPRLAVPLRPLSKALALALAVGGTSISPTVSAQDAPATLAPVVVTATRTERLQLEVPASVDLIDGETVRDAQLRVNLSESLTRVPGIVVLNRQNYAQDLQISIRGFGSRASFGVRGVRLYVDGVPANSPDGQGQVSHFPLNLADRIEVLRGPFSALYGNSSGGVIALTTQLKPQEPRFELSGAAGSDGTWRGGFTGRGGTDGYAFTLDATRFKTDGAREHSAAQRDTMNLRVGFLDTPVGKIRLSLNSLAMPDSQDPLGMSRSDLALRGWTGVTQTALDFDTRKTSRQTTLGASVETPLGDRLLVTTSAWVGTRAVMQYQAIPTGAQTPASSPGGVIDFDRTFGGIDLRATYQQGPLSASLGVDAQRLDEDRRGYQNFTGPAATPTARGVLGPLRRDENNLVQSVDPYLQAEWRITPKWLLHAGVRASRVTVDSHDRFLTNGDDSGAVSFNGTNPTAGIVFRASPAVSLYTSYARGFETPTLNELAYRPDGSAGLNTALKPSKSDNLEAGLKVVRPRASYGLALFRVTTSDEIVVLRNTGGRSSFGNATETRRDGIEASLSWRPADRLSLFASAGLIDARYTQSFQACRTTQCSLVPTVPPQPNAPETIAADNTLPGIPARTLFLEASYKAGFADLAVQWRGQSALWVNDTNTDRASGYGVLGLSIARTLDVLGRQPRVFARVDNALDKRYFGSVIVNEGNSRFFEPAPGRTWLVGLDWPL